MFRKLLPCLLLVVNVVFAQEIKPENFVFTHVNVIPMDRDVVLNNQTVLIENGKISAIGNSGSIEIPKSVHEINGEGKYLVPGIAEMHAHIPSLSKGMEYIEETLFLYLSNGITTIRGMLGEAYHLELKKDVADGKILSPRIYTSSPSLNGSTIKTKEEAHTKVVRYQKDGYDFLKIHPGIKLDVFNEMVKTANEVGIPFSGHVPVDVGIRRAIAAKYASIDHVDGYLEGLVPDSEGVDPSANGFFGFNFTDLTDESLIPELVNATKLNGVWIVTTQSLMERWAGDKTSEDLAGEFEMQYISKGTLSSWKTAVSNFQNGEDYDANRARKFNQIRRNLIKKLQEGGVGLLLGSDAPQIFNVPGFSIQHELGYMVASGLTPFEALQTGSTNPAKFFGGENEFGMIKEGYSADLVLLKENPLEDISAFGNNSGVMVRGTWLSEDTIKARLALIAEKYSK